ncbi:MAG TPA: ABC transporter permease [Candidatus Acidoferrales bacterium]|nr:ABC transporter permease [Candidatus Acidoferrales bacterium]
MPDWMNVLASRIRGWLSMRSVDTEFERELEDHLQRLTEENVSRGMAPEEARRAARLKLGGTTQLREANRELRGLPFVETFFQDIRYALRMLRKNPGFTAVAVLTLALGIGANTAIFSVVYAVVLKPLPYVNSEQLFHVFEAQPQAGIAGTGWSYVNFEELREQNHVFSEMAGTQQHQLTLTGRGEPSVVNTSVVTPELFSVFGEQALAGRVFFSEDGKPGAPPVVILSESLWRGTFGADPNTVGSSINLDKRSFTVVGIMPAAFRFPRLTENEQLWIPLVQDPLFGSWMDRRGGHWLQVTGRLKPGVSTTQAQAELDGIAARFAKEFPAENEGWTIRLAPLQQMIIGNMKSPLLVLLGAVGLVLLIACANIANLLLTRATSRAREIAVRTALGAGRARIVRQLLSEAAVLGLLGGVTGIALAYWGVQGLSSFFPSSLPRVNAIRVDNLVLGFALLLSLAASCAFGLAPALFAANSNLQSSLREGGGRSGESRNRRRARSFLAAGEIALAMVLLVAAGLLLRSFAKLMSVSPGFNVQHIVKADISLPQFQYSTPQQWITFSDEFLARIQAQPGLRDSAVVVPRPIADGEINLAFQIVGNPPLSAGASRATNYVSVSPEYFRVMGIPLLSGRFFGQRDVMASPHVTVISKTMARLYFPNQDPLGKQLTVVFPFDSGAPREIVGIVGDVRDVALGQDPGPMMYVPFAQAPFWGANLVVKSTLSPSSVAAAIRQEVRKIDKDLPVTDVGTMPDIIETSLAQPRFRTFLLGLFAAMALVLAATGIFGVISYSVSRRTNEIGIRVALGASRGSILQMVLRETLVLTFTGMAVGVPCALAASRLLGHMLFGVSANDPATLAAVTFALVAVAAFAGYVPARRAMRVDPMVALRYE